MSDRGEAENPKTPLREALDLCRQHFSYGLFFSALVNLAYLAPTLYMLQVYDRVVAAGSRTTLLFITLILAATLAVLVLLDHVRTRILATASAELDALFSGRLFRFALSAQGARTTRVAQLMRDFDTIRMAATGPGVRAVFDAPWIPIYILVCFVVHPYMGLFTLSGAVLLFGLAAANEAATRQYYKQASEAGAGASAVQDGVGGSAEVVRALGMSEAFVAQFEAARLKANRPQAEAADATGRIGGVIRFLRLFLQSAGLGLGAWLAIDKQISAGSIFACSMLGARALSPIDQIVTQWRPLSSAMAAYATLRKALDKPARRALTQLPDPAADLTVDKVGILNPTRDKYLLRDAAFAAKGGAVVAVIGPSGAGKSTLLQALANVRAPDQGVIRLGGVAYGDWDTERLGRLIGYLPQDCVLFPGTVTDNISRFEAWSGRERASVDLDAVKAAQFAGVHELILKLPNGYDTMIGARGRGLSAGQQQSIALARAVYGAPPLYVLDEPNSNLDGDGEANLIRVVRALRSVGALVVIAAHKMSLIAEADFVAVLRDGRMERFGPARDVLDSLKPGRPAGLSMTGPV